MADANTAAETVIGGGAPASVSASDVSERNGRTANLDPSSTTNPQYLNPNPSGLPSVLNPTLPWPAAAPISVPQPFPPAVSGSQFMVQAYQAPGMPPPGVGAFSPSMVPPNPLVAGGTLPQVPVQNFMAQPYGPGGQPLRYGTPIPNGYAALPQGAPPGVIPPPGVSRYPTMYGSPMVRQVYPPHPVVGVMPPMVRPLPGGIHGPVTPIIARPPAPPSAASSEKPQTTVYVGKISSTVENDFILSLLQLCGQVKSWKRPQDPAGTLKGFGFCEFESPEGVLRALRLLNKLNVDGQELMLNVNQTTRLYLNHYVERKAQGSKSTQESNAENSEKKEATADSKGPVKSSEPVKSLPDDVTKNDSDAASKENSDSADFGLVTDDDREADREALGKLKGLIEERLKNRPLPPPPPAPIATDGATETASELPATLRDRESDGGLAPKDSVERVADDKTSESKLPDEIDKSKSVSPDRTRHRGKDWDRESKRDKEREIERYEREREQERAKREKDKEYRSRDDDRRYKLREKEWEAREREKEHWRKWEREREREKAQERKWEIMDQERDTDEGFGKKRRYRISDDERKRRQREKEEDLADRLQEEEEIAEAKVREEQQKKQNEMLKSVSGQPADISDTDSLQGKGISRIQDKAVGETVGRIGGASKDEASANGATHDSVSSLNTVSERQNSNAPARKLGFGISASGKRAAVPSLFNEDEDEDLHKEKKMKPLVPIDYTTEEQQAVHSSVSEPPDHMVAAAEFVKRIATANSKEDKHDSEKEKVRRSRDRSSQRDADRFEEDSHRKDSRSKNVENQKLLDAKQLIDTIPKTKDELFSYKINWTVYDQNSISARLRPWVAKKITDFLGEEEDTLVDYIVSGTQEHVSAGEMLERLQTILDDEAEMFVLKMWRMLIFEIKKVETGIAVKPRS